MPRQSDHPSLDGKLPSHVSRRLSQSDDAAHLEAILDSTVDGIVVIDVRGKIERMNRAARRMFGYTDREAIGRNVRMLMPEPFYGEHDRYLADYLQTGRAGIIGIGREATAIRKDKSIFPIELAVSEVRTGDRVSFVGIVRDITARKNLEKEVLDVSEREQCRIGREIHDGICQELAGIAFMMHSMQQELEARRPVTSQEVSAAMHLLQDAVRHARSLSHSLYAVEPRTNGLAVALRQLALDTTDIFKVNCTFRCGDSAEVFDAATATHLYRIAQEAVRDAIRHGKASRIEIELIQNANGLELSVCDDGIGLNADGRFREDMVLPMMKHRARVIQAELQLLSRTRDQGGGVRVLCILRLSRQKR